MRVAPTDCRGRWDLPARWGWRCLPTEVTARESANMGMIWEAVPDDDFVTHWWARAAHLAKGSTAAHGATKRALRDSYGNDLAAHLHLEAELQGDLGQTRDFREGVSAFLEKRLARFGSC